MEKKLAVSRLHLSDGTVLTNQVAVFREGRFLRCYPLTEEEAFTAWFGGDFFVGDAFPDSPP
ncbi:MAG: hypothetical protein IJ722_00775 [Alloprevotella sp.]|nr:hypothetical protein [Alloprevotella sp.]